VPKLIERLEEAIYLPTATGMIGNSCSLERILVPSQFPESKGTFIKRVMLATPSKAGDDRYQIRNAITCDQASEYKGGREGMIAG